MNANQRYEVRMDFTVWHSPGAKRCWVHRISIDISPRNQRYECRVAFTGGCSHSRLKSFFWKLRSMTQLSLFSSLDKPTTQLPSPSKKESTIDAISGLQYIKDYVNQEEHDWLVNQIDKHLWLDDLKRRVQHYGFKYDYKARKVNWDMHIGELPEWLKRLSHKLHKDGHMPEIADQVIINEYLPGQGIASHIDCEPCFKNIIVSLSLGSDCVMNFTNKFNKTKKIPVRLAQRSLVVLSGEARYEWLHGISARKSDEWDGEKHERQRRVSLTFRKVIIKNEKVPQR